MPLAILRALSSLPAGLVLGLSGFVALTPTLASAADTGTCELPASPLLHYPFESEAAVHPLDESSGRTGLAAETVVLDSGIVGSALSFPGSRRVGVDLTALTWSDALTIAGWVRLDPGSAVEARLFSQATGVLDDEHTVMASTFETTGLRLRLRVGEATRTLRTDGGLVEVGAWHHVAFTYDGSAMAILLDGETVAQAELSGPIAADDSVAAALGDQPLGAGDRALHGALDDLVFYDTALSSADVAKLIERRGSACGTSVEPPGGSPGELAEQPPEPSAPVSEPVAVSAAATSARSVSLRWTPSDDPGRRYRIEHDGSVVADGIDGGGWTDTAVEPDRTYIYGITAVSADGRTSTTVYVRTITPGEAGESVPAPGDPGTPGNPADPEEAPGDPGDLGAVPEDPSNGPVTGVPSACEVLADATRFYPFDTERPAGPLATSGGEDAVASSTVRFRTGVAGDAAVFSTGSALSLGTFAPGARDAVYLSAWIRPDAASHPEGRILSQATGLADESHRIMASLFGTGALRLRLKLDGETRTLESSDGIVAPGRWTPVLFGYDGNLLTIHAHGALVASAPVSGTISQSSDLQVAVGNQAPGAGERQYVGDIDRLALFDRPLDAAEILALATVPDSLCPLAAGSPAEPVPEPEPEPKPEPEPEPEPEGPAVPAAPSGFVAETVNATVVVLAWRAAEEAQGTEVRYRLTGSDGRVLPVEGERVTVDGLRSATTYEWQLRTVDRVSGVASSPVGLSVTTAEATDPPPPPPPAPEEPPTTPEPRPGDGTPFADAALVYGLSATTARFGDLDGDGDEDLFVADGGIYHDNGPVLAWFEAPNWRRHDLGTPLEPFTGDSQIADFDGDGDLDIAVAADPLARTGPTDQGSVYWYENRRRGKGGWTRRTVEANVPDARHIGELRAGDVDGDGRIDLVGRHLGAYRIVVWFNEADGSWTPRRLPVRPREGLELGDVDEDGMLDIIGNGFVMFAPDDARRGAWRTLEIDAAFSSQPVRGLNNTTKAALVDLDGDGRRDLLFSGAEGDPLYMAWYRAPADRRNGTWTRRVIERGLRSHQALVADFDLDGDPDLFGGDSWDESGVYWWENVSGDASRFERRSLFTDRGCYSCTMADVDGDGDVDVAGPSTFHEEVWFYENRTID